MAKKKKVDKHRSPGPSAQFHETGLIDGLQIHDERQAARFAQGWTAESHVAFARFEIGTVHGRSRLCIDALLYHPRGEVFCVLGIISEGEKLLFPSVVRHWPGSVLGAIATRLRQELRNPPSQYEVRQLSAGPLPFGVKDLTIERVMPGMRDYCTVVNHIKRYTFARSKLDPGTVLDCASGTGYGASIMLHRPDITSYTGADLSAFAVNFGGMLVKDVRAAFVNRPLAEIDSEAFDNVVSLETIEHTTDPHQFLSALSAKMRPNGQLILSLPAERWGGSHLNPYHLTNWTYDRFERLVSRFFDRCEIHQQRLSLLGPETFSASEVFTRPPVEAEDECFIAVLQAPRKPRRQRIVVKRRYALGDVIWTTPVVDALRAARPDADIVMATDKTEVYMANPAPDIVSTTAFEPNADDEVIDLDSSYESNRRAHILDAYAKTAGTGRPSAPPRLFPSAADFRSVAEALGRGRWREKGVTRIVSVHMAATSPDRIWPLAHWREYLRELLSDPAVAVVMVGSGNDFDASRIALPPSYSERILSFVNSASLLTTAAAVAVADLFVGPDSGMAHVAAAVGTRSVVLFGMAVPETRLPLDGSGTGIWTDAECRGCINDIPPQDAPRCRFGKAFCYDRISAAQVLEETRRSLSSVTAGSWIARLGHHVPGFSLAHKGAGGSPADAGTPLTVTYLSNDPPDSACPMIRIFSPLARLSGRIGLHTAAEKGKEGYNLAIDRIKDADILLIQRTGALFWNHIAGLVRPGTKIVYELDDNFFEIPEGNNNRQSIDQMIPQIIEVIRRADAVTVSTAPLRARLLAYNPNIHVLPNCIDLAIWEGGAPAARRDGAPLVIGFFGTPTHQEDLRTIVPAVTKVLDGYGGRVVFRFFGCIADELRGVPGVQFVNCFTPDYRAFARFMKGAAVDIGLAPLQHNSFNECKSNIKFLEYALCRIPGIYADLAPYRDTVRDGENGLLCGSDPESWYRAMARLIEDGDLRRRMADAAYRETTERYSVEQKAHQWEELYRSLTTGAGGHHILPQGPRVSIIIPVYNKVEFTGKCLDALERNTPPGLCEVIVVDNGSGDGTEEYLKGMRMKGLRTIRNEENLGFAKACNQGAQAASSEYLLFLNNDTEPREGWLGPLVTVLDRDASVAAAGSRLLFPDGTIQHAGVLIADDRKGQDPLLPLHAWYGKAGDLPEANRMMLFPALTAACVLVRAKAFEQAGGFDEGFRNGYEDVDLCLRLREKGWKLVYQPESAVIHHESKSGPERFRHARQNIERLHEKWLGKAAADVVRNEDGSISETGATAVQPYVLPADGRGMPVQRGLVSIVILTFNQLSYTKECIESIGKHTSGPHEIIFVDNGSGDGTVTWLRQLVRDRTDYKLIENNRNLGFARGCNQGIEASSGEHLLLLNNDVVVTEGWLTGLLECLTSGPDVGIVGPMTNNISGRQKIPVVDYQEISQLDEYARSFREKNRHRRVPSRRIVGFCMLFRRGLIDSVGALDERFGSGNFEDDDLCLRAALMGYRNVIAGDVFIHHYGSRSFIGNKINYSSALQRNEALYRNKWANADPASALGKKLLALHSIDEAREHSLGGDLDRAVQAALNGIRHAPEHGDLYFAAAEMLLEAKQFTNALEALNELPAGIGEQRKLELTGYCHDGLGQLDEAAACADAALTRNGRSAPALNLKGVLSFRRQRPDEAMQWFRRAIESDGSYGEAYTNLGVLAWSAERKEEALDLFERGFRLSPTSGDIATSYQSAFTLLAQFERAEGAVREALALHAGSRRLRYMLIDILIHRNNAAGALAEMERAMAVYGAAEILPFALEQRALVGPKEIDGTRRKDATISLCMIVKNEEQHLARCLQSARSVADEIIVVDTGSTDRTKDIARACGAKVFDFAWTGSFAEARNASIEHASGAWVLVLDADEVISPLDHGAIREAAKKNGSHPSACSLVTRNYVQSVHVAGWRANDGSAVEEAGTGWFPSEKVRLFPRDSRIRFENAVHELVEPSLARHKVKIRKISVPVHHYGKLDEQKTKTKGEEYYLLGKKKLEEQGGDVDALSELAIQAGSLGRYEDAVALWTRVIGLKPGAAAAHLNLGAACLELGRYGEAFAATRRARELAPGMREAAYNHSVAAIYGGDAQTAVSLLEELLAKTPDYAAATVMLAAARCCAGQRAKGQELFRSLRASGNGFAGSLAEFAGKLRAAGRADYAAELLDAAMEAGFDDQALSRLREECRPGAAACS